MIGSRKCSACGAELPFDAHSGHCLQCLLKLGLDTQQEVGPTGTIHISPTSVTPANKPGDWIGPYKLLQQIGEGGCGVVYMAEQEKPMHRRVALKVIKLGMDTKSVIARFEAERQALALMDHPNIAKVLDAGATEAGRPYFVMELVRGIKITDYCDQNSLTTRERLDLFIQVCRAIQHAHQKGIIHRDIKPSNILVTMSDGIPVPKVIDFGIAKATQGKLTDHTLFTAFEQFIGTPAYMSPEQAEMSAMDIDTRSDIYSLGVLLYELLTGDTPFDAKELIEAGLDGIRRTIREVEPAKPSTRLSTMLNADLNIIAKRRKVEAPKLVNLVRGDLDWIVMKTLEKDRTRRYETANGLAADVQRHLSNEPVSARSPSSIYRFQMMVRRHKVTFAASSVVLATIVLGLAVSMWSLVKERQARRHADEQSQRALVAEKDIQEQLWNSELMQARAERWSHRLGRRADGLELLKKAANFRTSLDLRNEAIACLALTDLRLVQRLTNDLAGSSVSSFDCSFERCAIGDEYGNTSVRDVQSGHELMSLQGIGTPVNGLLFSPDNRRLAVIYGLFGINKHALQVWDLASQQVIGLEPAITNCRTMGFSADGNKLVVAQFPFVISGIPFLRAEEIPSPILLYDLKSFSQIKSFPTTLLPWGIALNPTGRRLAVSSAEDNVVIVRDVTTGEVIWSLEHPEGVRDVVWNDSGNLLATACANGSIYLWEMSSGKLVRTLSRHQSAVIHICFNHRGNLLASTGWDGRLRLWNLFTGDEICNWPCEWEQYGVKFSSDDDRLSLYGYGKYGMKHSVFEIDGGDKTNVLKFITTENQEIWGIAYSADGRVLASIHSDGLRFWDARTGAQVGFQAIRNVGAVAFDRQGKYLFTDGTQAVQVWPVERSMALGANQLTLGAAKTISRRPEQGKNCRPFNQARTMVALISNGKVCLIDLTTRQEKGMLAAPIPFENAAVSDNGRWCAATSYNDTVATVFDLSNSRPVKLLSMAKQFKTLAFSPDNRWLVTGDNERYQFWDTASWRCRFSVSRAATAGTGGQIAFSADGRMAAVASSSDLVQLVDLTTGTELATIESSAPQKIYWLEFNPDGSQLAVNGIGHNHYIQLWDLSLLREKLAAIKLDW